MIRYCHIAPVEENLHSIAHSPRRANHLLPVKSKEKEPQKEKENSQKIAPSKMQTQMALKSSAGSIIIIEINSGEDSDTEIVEAPPPAKRQRPKWEGGQKVEARVAESKREPEAALEQLAPEANGDTAQIDELVRRVAELETRLAALVAILNAGPAPPTPIQKKVDPLLRVDNGDTVAAGPVRNLRMPRMRREEERRSMAVNPIFGFTDEQEAEARSIHPNMVLYSEDPTLDNSRLPPRLKWHGQLFYQYSYSELAGRFTYICSQKNYKKCRARIELDPTTHIARDIGKPHEH